MHMYRFFISSTYSIFQVVITNIDDAVMDLDAKKWPDAPADDASSFYKVIACHGVVSTALSLHRDLF